MIKFCGWREENDALFAKTLSFDRIVVFAVKFSVQHRFGGQNFLIRVLDIA